jgi:CubicO group peptidase (beta-lactamase class C family)
VLREARGKWFTGCGARVARRGRVVFERAYGVTRDDALGRPVYVDTPFDLASITKVFVSTLALRAVEDGRIALDEPLTRIVPEWNAGPKCAITLRMLLAHTSGLNSGADYRRLFGSNVVRFTLESELIGAPGERVVYSDLGFIALGAVLERLLGRSLRSQFAAPAFRDSRAVSLDIPATEDDGWRNRVQGFVHDEKAFLMGGTAGHAGLFGTAADVGRLAETYLGALAGRSSIVRERTAAEAVREHGFDPVLRRGLGWALKTSDENSCGRWWSPQTFGHTGFVGTCVWADPVRDVSAVLLTNSVYFGRRDSRELRAAFYEGVLTDLDLR